jgi:hypothetical protein
MARRPRLAAGALPHTPGMVAQVGRRVFARPARARRSATRRRDVEICQVLGPARCGLGGQPQEERGRPPVASLDPSLPRRGERGSFARPRRSLRRSRGRSAFVAPFASDSTRRACRSLRRAPRRVLRGDSIELRRPPAGHRRRSTRCARGGQRSRYNRYETRGPLRGIAVSRSCRSEEPRWKRGSEVVDLTRT